jgi:hypothetical protein
MDEKKIQLFSVYKKLTSWQRHVDRKSKKKKGKTIFQANRIQKQAGVAILTSDKATSSQNQSEGVKITVCY